MMLYHTKIKPSEDNNWHINRKTKWYQNGKMKNYFDKKQSRNIIEEKNEFWFHVELFY
jgi:hypothetical protein